VNGSAISRHLMAALFLVAVVPILGWSVVVDLAEQLSHRTLGSGHEAIVAQTKVRLVFVLGASLFTLAAALLHLRRVLVAPLESLALRARQASGTWQPPPECARADEIGDLARALDESVRELSERAERARRFAADLSHELRTPLAAVQGAAELLAHEQLSSEEAQRFHENILRESQRLGRLVEGILELERGAHDPGRHAEGCELRDSIRRVLDGVSLLAGRKEIRLKSKLPEDDAWVQLDPDRHDRVLFALLENALKFSPAGQAVMVELEPVAEGYRVSVSDRGPGVPESERSTIFERHVQTALGKRQRGSGLGLAIARALVESWGGRIGVQDADGAGARFVYLVPVRGD
jgi:signal transduction histidine kinase